MELMVDINTEIPSKFVEALAELLWQNAEKFDGKREIELTLLRALADNNFILVKNS